MSSAIDFYEKNSIFFPRTHEEKLKQIEVSKSSSELFSQEGHFFNAGIILYKLIDDVWGLRDSKILFEICNKAIDLLEREIQNNSSNENTILSYTFIIDTLGRIIPLLNNEKNNISDYLYLVQNNLASFLFDNFKDHKNNQAFLVSGFRIEGSISSNWEIVLNHQETAIYKKGGGSSYAINSAFDNYLNSNDYISAHKIIEINKSFFDSNYLRGWLYAIKGIVYPSDEVKYFKKSYEEFSKDYKEGWSNPGDLWAKYFKSRYFLSVGLRNKDDFKKLLNQALDILGEMRSGLINYQILKYKYVIEAFVAFFILKDSNEIIKAHSKICREIKNSYITNFDSNVLDFINQLSTLTKEIETDPENGIFNISNFGELIRNFPLFNSSFDNSKRIMGAGLKDYLYGKTAWIYKALQSIKSNEIILQKIVLNLFQAKYPRYSHRVHGNFENGRDLFVLPQNEDTLKVIQVKLGDINLPDWRKIKPQLEEMMETHLPEALIRNKITRKVGILLFNGHIKPNVDAVISDWQAKRLENMYEEYEFMNIDDLVNFIVENSLVSEFRLASIENGLKLQL